MKSNPLSCQNSYSAPAGILLMYGEDKNTRDGSQGFSQVVDILVYAGNILNAILVAGIFSRYLRTGVTVIERILLRFELNFV